MSNDTVPEKTSNSWATSVSTVLKAAVQKIGNERFLLGIVLFVVAATAAAVVTVLRPDSSAAATTSLVIVVAGLVFLRLLLPRRIKRDDVFVRAKSVADIRQMLDELGEKEIEQYRVKHGLPPFAEDRDTLRKKANDLFDNLPIAQLKSLDRSIGRRIIIPAVLTIILGASSLVILIVHQQTEQEDVIRQFYSGINNGLAGEENGWKMAWSACAVQKQEGFDKIAAKLFGAESTGPTNLATLYEDSSEHRIRSISLDKRISPTEERYLVIYDVNERAPFNDAAMDISFQTTIGISEYFEKFPNASALVDEIIGNLKYYYEMKSDAELYKDMSAEDLEFHIRNQLLSKKTTMQSITKGTMIRILGIIYRLRKKDFGHAAFTTRIYRHFLATYITHIVLRKDNGEWRIESFKMQAEHFKPVQPQ